MTTDLVPSGDDEDNGSEVNDLIKQLEQLISDAPPERREALLAQITQFSFRGPLPPPGMLAQYGEIMPDLPERIVAMAEREQALAQERVMARIAFSDRVISADSQRTNRGMVVAIGAAAGGLAVAFWLIAVGAYWPAIGAFLGDLMIPAAMVISALIGRARKNKD